ncbi:MAG: RluA family pseudouridine synthase [Ignavibacteria bacterium]|nr:RluA family pseudouridine synthase [Ignavibacteria bacterium]MBK7412534.1 RluA family pseudouridine synthase [Ignavibacteria bacterium]MBK9183293.1 RluA family pseudouridine synthase [Ignavibacteria bacterium]MBL0320798.1 RluA family pseudouridine synthase [Ignavibacteria bacterium]
MDEQKTELAAEDPNYPTRIEHVYEFTISPRQKPERLDAFITKSILHATRTRVQKAIETDTVLVNDKPSRANYKVRPGDVIRVTVMKPPPLQLIPQDIPLDIAYEDDHLMVIHKPPGILAHPGLGNRSGTLVNAVLYHLGFREPIDVLKRREGWGDDESNVEGPVTEDQDNVVDDEEFGLLEDANFDSNGMRPGIVHRLDKDTSGIMVIGKTYEATLGLATQFANRTVSREYIALAWGVIKDDAKLIEGDIGRSPKDRKLRAMVQRGGKYAATEVTVLERYDCATLIACKLRTGRTHQIRVHLTSIRHPLVGDPDYGGRESHLTAIHHTFRKRAQLALTLIKRQALHARLLGFTHPITNERMTFESPIPADMQACIYLLR